MNELENLEREFPGSVIEQPPCGALASHFIEKLLTGNAPSIIELSKVLRADPLSKEITLEAIKVYFEQRGFFTYPCRNTLQELDLSFDSYIAILHGDGHNVGEPEHFVVAIKNMDQYWIVDPPTLRRIDRAILDLDEVSKSLNYSNIAMVISDAPLSGVPTQEVYPVAIGVSFLVLGIVVVAQRMLRRRSLLPSPHGKS